MIEVTHVDHMGKDLSVANAARVSFGKKSDLDWSDPWSPPKLREKDAKLIRYLAEHKHISPFGHCFASFHIKAPVFVARQLVKHKFLRWNEISRRYVDNDPEFYVPDVWRGRSEDKKQGSSEEVITEFLVEGGDRYTPDHLKSMMEINDGYDSVMQESCLSLYRDFIKAGVSPEQARMVLPQSMMTEWYWSGSLDAFADMCNLRCKPDTQAETRFVADAISEEMEKLFPVSWEALTKEKEDGG
jgi:thymidylate synthase (FAD)